MPPPLSFRPVKMAAVRQSLRPSVAGPVRLSVKSGLDESLVLSKFKFSINGAQSYACWLDVKDSGPCEEILVVNS